MDGHVTLDTTLALLNRVSIQVDAIEEETRKRKRGEEETVNRIRKRHNIQESVDSVEELLELLSRRLMQSAEDAKNNMWEKHRAASDADVLRRERDQAILMSQEIHKRIEMDGNMVSSYKKRNEALEEEVVSLRKELQEERSVKRAAETEERRELARLRRELDHAQAKAAEQERLHGEAMMKTMNEMHTEIDNERSRTHRHDTANRKFIEKLRVQLTAEFMRRQAVELLYRKVVGEDLPPPPSQQEEQTTSAQPQTHDFQYDLVLQQQQQPASPVYTGGQSKISASNEEWD